VSQRPQIGRNTAGHHYGLTALCPIVIGTPAGQDRSYESLVRATLAALPLDDQSPFAACPNTYMARLFMLKDVVYESRPARMEHLQSQYLVFATDFHGELEPHLAELWERATASVQSIWRHCVGFAEVTDSSAFVRYIRRCQVDNALLFNGSTDQPLAEQLKGLYLKQQFGEFAATHQRLPAGQLRQAFIEFAHRVAVDNVARPTWRAGASTLTAVEVP
jgi:hypothetical protein